MKLQSKKNNGKKLKISFIHCLPSTVFSLLLMTCETAAHTALGRIENRKCFPFTETDPTSGRQNCGGKGSKNQGVGDAEAVGGKED